ncbi:proton-conducting transporter transmembrane domain-containing protein [Nocardia acidivorans]|uniref:proton-conducting transporter transmembrane domain-containing protein n=1 Tax=Nocardia acidivorans TaxID=404580 RepID=UPI001FE0E80F
MGGRRSACTSGGPRALAAAVAIGAITLLYGAIIGYAEDDIKKALAASTMSQIGHRAQGHGHGQGQGHRDE